MTYNLHRTCYLCPSIRPHRFTSSNTAQLKQVSVHSPYDYDDEIQQIPAVPQVGVGVEEQAVGYYLQECLNRENDEEQILHTLL